VSLAPYALTDLFGDMQRVADALEVHQRGIDLVAGLKRKMETIAARIKTTTSRPKLATIEWLDPLMAAGNWMPELIEMAGGTNLFGRAGEHSPWMKFDDLAARDPDAILLSPCGFAIARTMDETSLLTRTPGWSDLRAVREGRVFVADGNQYFNRPGPRIVESLEILAELLHPELFQFAHEGSGWRRL
jgi:iron complex transport system substrate-binding protein